MKHRLAAVARSVFRVAAVTVLFGIGACYDRLTPELIECLNNCRP